MVHDDVSTTVAVTAEGARGWFRWRSAVFAPLRDGERRKEKTVIHQDKRPTCRTTRCNAAKGVDISNVHKARGNEMMRCGG